MSRDLDESFAPLDRAVAHARAFLAKRSSRSPYARASREDLEAALGGPLPERGADSSAVVERLALGAESGLVGSAGPRFFSWVIGGSHPAGVAADWLTSLWGQNAGLHATSPAAAVTEQVAARWLLELLDLPRPASVGFVTGATMANFVGLAAARHAQLARRGWDVERRGLYGAPELRVVLGEEAHSTVFAALQYLGLGSERLIRVAADGDGRMIPEALEVALAAVRAAEPAAPILVVAQAGHIHSGAIDPLDRVVAAAHAVEAWVHVDGAFGLWARASASAATAAHARGIEQADSWATDGHKWLQTPYDCGLAIVRDGEAHRRAMTIAASYLPQAGAGERDPSDYVPELSRRARGFAAWAVLAALGRDGVAEMVDRHLRLARRFAEALRAEPGIEIPHDVMLDQVFVRFVDETGDTASCDQLTRETIERVREDGVCFVGGARWRGRWGMRFSIISWWTQEADIDASVASILRAFRAARAARSEASAASDDAGRA
jgi:glutamate/tyrosine decarboxylase-like PLP-dependent enzyme